MTSYAAWRDRRQAARRAQTENGRRAARFKWASARIQKIIDGEPPLTKEQRAELALMLLGEENK